eukprot:1159115-Pelagomonas_calceolata.AAC.12
METVGQHVYFSKFAAQDVNDSPGTRGLTAIAITLAFMIAAILVRKILAAAGYNVPSIVSSFSS